MNISLSDFVDSELREYANYDNDRSLPHLLDGLKTTQRKIIRTMLNGRENSKEIKVAQLSAFVAAETSYHHGEGSIASSIVTLCLNYAGTNNFPLMKGVGQFKTRMNPVSAASRYIFTQLSPNFRLMFRKEDDKIVESQFSDGMEIEPKFFLPIVPTVLLNSSEGIGNGFASDIQPRSLSDIISAVEAISNGKDPMRITPYYEGFKGTVEIGDNQLQWIIRGVAHIENTTTIKITELPIGMDLAKIQSILIDMQEKGLIKGYDDNSNIKSGFYISVYASKDFVSKFKKQDQLLKEFKLITKISENLTVWLPNGKLKNFSTEIELIKEFLKWRFPYYTARKNYLLQKMEEQISKKDNRMKFIRLAIENMDTMLKMKKKELFEFCMSHGFTEDQTEANLQIRIYDLTAEMVPILEDEIVQLKDAHAELTATTEKQLLLQDLKELRKKVKL